MLDLATMNASGRPFSGRWTLFLFGSFRLQDPLGLEIKLPNRKVEALLGVLALSRRFGISRDEVAEALWPERPLENQRANLRQALTQLRKSLGEEAIESSRSHLSLRSGFRLECDYDVPALRKGGGFMPGHQGDWFEMLRDESTFQEENSVASRESLVNRFSDDLNWLAEVDPRGMFDFLRTNIHTGKGIPFGRLLELLRLAGLSHASSGWADFWVGTLEDDLILCASHLRAALKEAKRTSDLELASEASLELGKVYSRTGNMEKALRMCDIADTVAERLPTKRAKANALRLRGTHLVTWLDANAGLALLAKSEEHLDDMVARTHLQATRAFYSASVGLFEEANILIQGPLKFGSRLGHASVQNLANITFAILKASSGQRSSAITELERLSQDSQKDGTTQLHVYAEEMLAKILDKEGEKSLASQKLVSAQQGRQSSQMTTTWIEEKRLSLITR